MAISLCMIVKNEEDWIEGALESVNSVVDEIIIADTGCTDRTIERTRRFSPKIIDFKWTENFGEARNRTVAEARHPWILVLDADERIAARDLPLLKDAIQQPQDGYHLVQRNYVFSNQVFGWRPNPRLYAESKDYPGYVDNPLIRFFRNDRQLRFRGAVHEIIDPTRLPSRFKFASIPVVLHHYGKVRGEERVAAKQLHYLALGLKKIQEDPADAKAHLDLGIQYQELQRHAEAVACFKKTFAMNRMPIALLYAAISEKLNGHLNEALELLDRVMQIGFKSFQVHLERGNTLLALGRVPEALREYKTTERLDRRNPIAPFNCGLAFRRMQDLKSAEDCYVKALRLDPSFDKAALELATLYASSGRVAQASRSLEALVGRRPDFREARLTLAKTYIQLDQSSNAIAILEDASDEDVIARSLLGAACLQGGNLDDAQRHLEFAFRKDRSLLDTRINLATLYAQRGDAGKAERFRLAAAAELAQKTAPQPRPTL
jgi:tetratricopeptide (TPR) repeat protein